MIDLFSDKEICPYCKSSDMEYYAFTYGGFHYYYKCGRCHKYIEYRMTLKNYLIINSIILMMLGFAFVAPFYIFYDNDRLAMLFSLLSAVLFLMVGYRYRWHFYELIALEDLQTGDGIIPAPGKIFRLLIVTIFLAALLGYTGIVIFNFMRQ